MKHIISQVKHYKIERNVIIVNKIENSKLQSYYNHTSLVIIPSLMPDNLPTVGIEALSVGRLIIGSNIGGIPEIIKNNETGFLVKPNNPTQLAICIKRLLEDDSLLTKMSKNSRIYAENTFDIDVHIKVLEDIYAKITSEKYS